MQQFTLDMFLDIFRQVVEEEKGWWVVDEKIRSTLRPWECPVMAVARKAGFAYVSTNPCKLAQAMGMDDWDALSVLGASTWDINSDVYRDTRGKLESIVKGVQK